MADIVLGGAANWSTCKSGGPPAAGDNIYLNGYVLTLDGTDGDTFTCALIRACASDGATSTNGTISLGALNTVNITANLAAGQQALLTLGAGKSATVRGNITGGFNTNAYGVTVNNATGSLTVPVDANNWTVTGGRGTTAHGAYCTQGTISLNRVKGSPEYANSHGCNVTTAANVTINLAIGGDVSLAHGVSIAATTGGATVTTAMGGSVAGALGAYITTGNLTLNGTDLTGVGLPFGGPSSGTVKMGNGVILQYTNPTSGTTKLYGPTYMPAASAVWNATSYGNGDYTGTKRASSITNCAAGNIKLGVTIDDVAGSYDVAALLPAVTDVWTGVSYNGGALTGTKRASSIANCSAGNIKKDVVIDNVTGTYEAGDGSGPIDITMPLLSPHGRMLEGDLIT